MPTFGDPGNRRVVQDVDPAPLSEIRYAWFSKKGCMAGDGEVALMNVKILSHNIPKPTAGEVLTE